MTSPSRASFAAIGLLVLLFPGAPPSGAGETDPPTPADSKASLDEKSKDCCDYWVVPPLYRDSGNPVLQELGLHGRYQGQYYFLDSDQGRAEGYETRRWRVGAHAKLFSFLTATADINLSDTFDPFYGGIDEAYLKADISEDLRILVGKFKPKWSTEGTTSALRLLTFERSLLVDRLRPEKSPGFAVDGNRGKWDYYAGAFSGDFGDEFGNFDEGVFTASSLGYDFSASTGLKKSRWHLDHLWSSTDTNTAVSPYDHRFATGFELGTGPWGVMGDLIYASGVNDAWGLVLMPTYDLSEKLQLVGRYQFAWGDGDSIQATKRYERKAPNLTDHGFGEQYNAFYLGVNYSLCGHRLKLMSGLEYANLGDGFGDGGAYDGWTWFNGLRLYF